MDGVLLADKPAGLSSHAVVAAVRRQLGRTGTRKGGRVAVGHAGTLDPFATGLLLVLVGRATRVQRILMGQRKAYETTARFGWTSSTGDPEGELVHTGRMPAWVHDAAAVRAALELPTGVLRQRPPAYSAIRVGGQRAYALARAGVEFELAERDVEVHRFERVGDDRFVIECSAGTYVRSLIADLGDAYCTSLRRTSIGPFDVRDARPFDPLEAGDLLGLDAALAAVLPVVELAEDDARRAGHGVAVEDPSPGRTEAEVLLRDADGPIAVAAVVADGRLKPVVGFRG